MSLAIMQGMKVRTLRRRTPSGPWLMKMTESWSFVSSSMCPSHQRSHDVLLVIERCALPASRPTPVCYLLSAATFDQGDRCLLQLPLVRHRHQVSVRGVSCRERRRGVRPRRSKAPDGNVSSRRLVDDSLLSRSRGSVSTSCVLGTCYCPKCPGHRPAPDFRASASPDGHRIGPDGRSR